VSVERRAIDESRPSLLQTVGALPIIESLSGLRGGALMVALIVFAVAFGTLIGPFLAPHDPADTSTNTLASPSWAHLMGTDNFGRDVFSRVLHSGRQDMVIAIAATISALALGSLLGAISAYAGRWSDTLLMRSVDVIQAFPMFILALGLVAVALSPGTRTMIIVIGIINIPIFARLMRAEVLARKSLAYVDAARCAGNPWYKILFYHLYPNAMGPILAQSAVTLSWAILDVAALSFLGVGVRPPTPEWGVMVAEGAPYMLSGQWWISFFPGLAIAVAVFAFNSMADQLQDLVDPRRRLLVRG
jgi:peptide/nickel transport system permease protein